jgi:hypothetical protein
MEIILIDLLGAGFEIFLAMVFFETFLEMKKYKRLQFIFGFFLVAVTNIVSASFLQNALPLPIVFFAIMFFLSHYFASSETFRLFISLIITAVLFTAEILIGIIITQMLSLPIQQLQDSWSTYMVGVLVSKLFALFVVFTTKVFMKNEKQEMDRKFNLIMAFMPLQSIILCFIVYCFTPSIDSPLVSTLGIVAVVVSLGLVFIIMLILNNQRKAMKYKQEYELAQYRLETQIEHDQKLYQTQLEVKSIRHDISNNLLAISGMLTRGRVEDAIKHIEGINADLKRTADVVHTGLPSMDAVLNAKIAKANKSDIQIAYTVLIESDLNVDQFDLAVVVANALDNAIEGILRSTNVEKKIFLEISRVSDYILILVENFTSCSIDENFRTAKPDKSNHGFGIAQMKAIAGKYNGNFKLVNDPKTGRVSLKILLES